MGALEGYIPTMTLTAMSLNEEFAIDGAAEAPEITKIDHVAASKIGSILCSRQEVYESFRVHDVIDPLDLQATRIAELQEQRVDLLRELHLGEVADVMRDPQIYFEGITLQFFEECGAERRIFSRARYLDQDTLWQKAHTSTFRLDPYSGIIEPEMQALIGFRTREIDGIQSDDPSYFQITTDLQNTKPGYLYIFSSTVENGFAIGEKRKDDYSGEKPTEVTDPVDRFTLLQALTVDMQAALHNRQPQNDMHARKLLAQQVYGPRSL